MDNLTRKSATASETQKGEVKNMPSKGICFEAQETSFEGSKNINILEKATKKKINVSKKDPTIDDISGAFHHFSFLR